MHQRIHERASVNIQAEVIVQNQLFAASVKNISARGIYARIAHAEPSGNIDSESSVNLNLQLPVGKTIKLNCIKKWSHKNTSGSLIESIGAEIIDPPAEYMKFIQRISQHSLLIG